MPPPYSRKAFTLSEVLITLVIIGIISAITVPTLFANHKWQEYKSALKKAHSTLNNAVNAYYLENGTFPECGRWKSNPYGDLVCSVYNDELGFCENYRLADGSPIPSDYNGQDADCESLLQSFQKTMQVQKICDVRTYPSCVPHYKNTPVTLLAIILNDGMIFYPSYNSVEYIAVDVNGMKGPNKWGYDLHKFYLEIADRTSAPQFAPMSWHLEKGGRTVNELLYGED